MDSASRLQEIFMSTLKTLKKNKTRQEIRKKILKNNVIKKKFNLLTETQSLLINQEQQQQKQNNDLILLIQITDLMTILAKLIYFFKFLFVNQLI